MSSPDRSREKIEQMKTARERVLLIARLMAAGRYVNGKTAFALAEKWQVHVDTAKRYAAEASRIIRAETKTQQELRALMVAQLQNNAAQLDRVVREGGYKSRRVVDAIRGKTEAIRVLAGIELTSHPDRDSELDSLESMSTQELEEYLKKQESEQHARANDSRGGQLDATGTRV